MSEQTVLMDGYCPGNGTRYELMLVTFEERPGRLATVFTWLNNPYGGRTMRLPTHGVPLPMDYVETKLGGCGSDADYAAIMVWVRENAKVPVCIPNQYSSDTGLRNRLHLVENK